MSSTRSQQWCRQASLASVFALVVACGWSGLAPSQAHAAPPAPCAVDGTIGDLDGDGGADVVIGVPTANRVDVFLSSGARQTITAAGLGLTASATGDAFGAAVSSVDLDGDGCSDLAIGAPGASAGAGAGYVAFGSPTGVVPNRARLDTSSQAGSRMGSAVAIGGTAAAPIVFFGAPGYDVGAKLDAGAVVAHKVTASGALSPRVVLTLDSAGVPGTAGSGNRFGGILAGSTWLLVAGMPNKSVSGVSKAGAVTVLDLRAWPTVKGVEVNQNTRGVPGTPGKGDAFGAAIATHGNGILVGIPNENVGTAVDAGAVQRLTWLWDKGLVVGPQFSQSSKGVAGASERGDHFGAAVAVGTSMENTYYLVGAPGEDVGTIRDAGAITRIIDGRPEFGVVSTGFTQGAKSLLGGVAETGDRLGSNLSIIRSAPGLDEDTVDVWFIGVPFEDGGSAADAGYALTVAWGFNGKFVHEYKSDAPTAGQRYGQSLAVPLS